MLVACSTWYTLCFIHQVIFDFESTFDFLVLRNNLSFNSNAFSREWFCTRPLFETAGGKRQISYGSLDFCYDPSIKYTKRFTFTDCGKSFFHSRMFPPLSYISGAPQKVPAVASDWWRPATSRGLSSFCEAVVSQCWTCSGYWQLSSSHLWEVRTSGVE